eukprot:CAMPEP_0172181796 /NCGR_PEP_ID=MMETSP1050-20130122/18027_1 /TAXON_ID=233186 /ORGANISM="Cryptomonas curvata, Strain CCAP979/52" /LENGTH=105 /DNA_ID=CAMNT_0012855139 /DNA_START=15 /DNA_END=330 /DNA_ORIENTATION=+
MGKDHHDHAPDARVPPKKEECAENRIDHGFRDYCAHKLIPLNQCRYREIFLPWKCVQERHAYEKCQFEEFQRRVKQVQGTLEPSPPPATRVSLGERAPPARRQRR